MLKKIKTNKVIGIIESSKKVLIIPSTPADGDAIGGALGLRLILQKLGKKVEVFYNADRISKFLSLPGADSIKITDIYSADFSKFDLVILLDGQSIKQFYDNLLHPIELTFPNKLSVVAIDHHPRNGLKIPIVNNPDSSSTSELICEMFMDKVPFDREIATNLFVGMSTDTSHFRHHAGSKTFQIAGELLKFGVDLEKIVRTFYRTDSLEVIKFSAFLTGSINFDKKFRYAYFVGQKSDWQRQGFNYEQFKFAAARVLDNQLISISDADFVFALFEKELGVFSGSFRTRIQGTFDVSVFARQLSGGGHENAAGFVIQAISPEKAVDEVQKVISKFYKKARIVSS